MVRVVRLVRVVRWSHGQGGLSIHDGQRGGPDGSCGPYGIPHICHGRHGRRPCKFFLAGVNSYRINTKNWQKLAFFGANFGVNWQKLAKKLAKIGAFLCKFYSSKILPV